MNRSALSIWLVAALAFSSATARAVVLDWDTVSWTAGSLSNSYDIDPANPGNDVTVNVVANNGAPFQPELVAPNPMTPAVSPSFQGGLSTIQNALCIALDLTSNTQSVTITIDFSSLYALGVTNVSFKIFDVDYANAAGSSTFQDQLSLIRALSIDGTTLIAPTITTSVNNTVSGTGIDQIVQGNTSTTDTGATSGDANVTIDFGNNAIRSFTFTYGGGPAFDDSTYQHIGLHDIDFTPVPEMNPVWPSIISCAAAAGLVLRLRKRARK